MIDKSDSKKFRMNDQIDATTVRLVGDDGGPRVVSMADAMKMAQDQLLDLVEITPGQDPPIVKIMDFSKFRFEQIKKARDAKKKQKVVHVKEIKLRPGIDEHDYEHKIKHAKEFLSKGDKVKFTMMFRGREIMHQDIATKVMDGVMADLEKLVVIEKKPALEGKNMIMIVSPIGGVKTHDDEE